VSTEQIVRMSLSGLMIIGYAVVLIAYIWAPPGSVADDKVAASLVGALTAGYLLAINSIFGSKP
jgi:hypothetical protein